MNRLAAERAVCWPATELAERDDEFVLSMALAGFEPSEITVTATPREILVKATRKQQKKSGDQEETKVRWTEFRSDEVLRRVELPGAVNVEKTVAKLESGLLEIVVPKMRLAVESAKRIEVATKS